MIRTYEEINEKIKKGKAVVFTAEEVIALAKEKGVKAVTNKVDVVTTGTFSPMCSSGAFLNLGHTDPPMKMSKVWLNEVEAYGGIAAVDCYLGATQLCENSNQPTYGGAHVLEALIKREKIKLRSSARITDCYPRKEIETEFDLDSINQAILFNPRNVYQNYQAAVNSSLKTLYTYMGTLLPNFGNVTYATSGEISPLLKDPEYRTIGIGTRIFIGGTIGYVAWEGTQHNPSQIRGSNKIPLDSAGSLALVGNLKKMERRYLRAAYFKGYGPTLYLGVGIPIPILDEALAEAVSINNKDIYTTVYDYAINKRSKPSYGRFSYQQLRSGSVNINGGKAIASPLSSLARAKEVCLVLKEWIGKGNFFLTQPLEGLSKDTKLNVLKEK
ncbi:MAG: homocysteine biosynthesis protein [bacterium]